MENPEEDILDVIRSLTMGTREEQNTTLCDYFLPNAYFVHPFCCVPSLKSKLIRVPFTKQEWVINSRLLVLFTYQWYKIMSPKISLSIHSTSFDEETKSLCVAIQQTFTLWLVPSWLWQAKVNIVCLLKLVQLNAHGAMQLMLTQNGNKRTPNNTRAATYPPKNLYFIRGQEDRYRFNGLLKFIVPLGVSVLYYMWQFLGTVLCIFAVIFLWPVTSAYEHYLKKTTPNDEKDEYEAIKGSSHVVPLPPGTNNARNTNFLQGVLTTWRDEIDNWKNYAPLESASKLSPDKSRGGSGSGNHNICTSLQSSCELRQDGSSSRSDSSRTIIEAEDKAAQGGRASHKPGANMMAIKPIPVCSVIDTPPSKEILCSPEGFQPEEYDSEL
ncbi:hypothetical protein ONZ43_g1786 [Nemania bipapillata]|uniref:Uncharacterized protein n=1 Tax=Nemania bipapillata TaxID=110536 RepID=A0ACC2J352_9PEZI|nr:hypothetical protein ONZ43_g1786 [Nemania bipapillata]